MKTAKVGGATMRWLQVGSPLKKPEGAEGWDSGRWRRENIATEYDNVIHRHVAI